MRKHTQKLEAKRFRVFVEQGKIIEITHKIT